MLIKQILKGYVTVCDNKLTDQLTIHVCLGRIHTERKARYNTSPKRIIMWDLAGKTTRTRSQTCKPKTIGKLRTRLALVEGEVIA